MAKHSPYPGQPSEYGMFTMNDAGTAATAAAAADDRSNAAKMSDNTSSSAIYNPFYTGTPRTPPPRTRPNPIDRHEIIRRIKSGGSRPTSPELERPCSRSSLEKRKSPVLGFKTVLAASEAREDANEASQSVQSIQASQSSETAGLEIERPRSALHRGDFRERDEPPGAIDQYRRPVREEVPPLLSTSPPAPWHPDFPMAGLHRPPPYVPSIVPTPRPVRARAVSNASLASSFVKKPPTSPLVQTSRPDTPDPGTGRRTPSPDKTRRHTFSPRSFNQLRVSADNSPFGPGICRHAPALRSESTFPCQAHQPRRSLNTLGISFDPSQGFRRPSLSDSPLHLAPMVGSYEESILRGRMSTTPSKPLNFVAQIGVLGKGDCKASLRCPPHVTVPFPAVFYSYGSGAKGMGTDQPSPYVGLVDLENGIQTADGTAEKRRQRRQAAIDSGRVATGHADEHSSSDVQSRNRRKQKQKRRSGSPKAPPGGSYRIPQQGQIQVVIKNPNKTAVKLFLVPYDLSDMEPGQKTFIRQRSYAAGPIIDMPLTARRNLGTDRPEASLGVSSDPHDKPMLRYLVHLHICCPSKGRFFLYKSVRVVFANRVPDGKEKLRNEIQLPEPRYSTYKRSRDSNVGSSNMSGNASRGSPGRQDGLVASTTPPPPPGLDSQWFQRRKYIAQSLPTAEFNPDFAMPMQPLRLYASPLLATLDSRPSSRQLSDEMETDSSSTIAGAKSPASAWGEAFPSPPQSRGLDSAFQCTSHCSARNINTSLENETSDTIPGWRALDSPLSFEREQRGSDQLSARGNESLIAQRLRDLAVQGQKQRQGD